jgi:hypothetical protein
VYPGDTLDLGVIWYQVKSRVSLEKKKTKTTKYALIKKKKNSLSRLVVWLKCKALSSNPSKKKSFVE